MSKPENLGTSDAVQSGQAPRTLRPRGAVMTVCVKLVGRWGARVGLAWIVCMLLIAVWAPVLASSHPFLWRHEGKVSSPWLEYLSPVDVVLFVSFFVGVGMLIMSRLAARKERSTGTSSGGGWLMGWLWLTVVAVLATPVWAVVQAVERAIAEGTAGVFGAQIGLVGVVLLAGLIGLPIVSKAPKRRKVVIGCLGLVLGAGLLAMKVVPPETVVYSAYREASAAGQVDWAVYAPLPYSANDAQRELMTLSGQDARFLSPSLKHPMGTTEAGMDLLSRMLHATRIALAIGLIATSISLVVGIVVGAWMGYAAGKVDLIGMRFVEIFSAIPVLFLLIMIVAFYGRSLTLMMIIIGLTGWVGYALFVRAEFLKLRKADYVTAARAVGASTPAILFRHMLPNGVTPVLVLASFGVGSAILYESVLSFLGLGLVDEPSWGQLLQEARRPGHHWGQVVFPGLAIFLTVFAYNLIGEALRDALDPRLIKSGDG